MARKVGFHVNDAQWIVGVPAFTAMAVERAEAATRGAAEAMLTEAKERVHVVSRKLQDSGRLEEHDMTEEGFEIDVVFGGDEYDVDYAGYEETLHPYLAPSANKLLSDFEARAGDYW